MEATEDANAILSMAAPREPGPAPRDAVSALLRTAHYQQAAQGRRAMVPAWAFVREHPGAPDPLLARLTSCRSVLPLRILSLCMLLDPELRQDPRTLAPPRDFRTWLAVPDDVAGQKQMSRALKEYRRHQFAWIEDEDDYYAHGLAPDAQPTWSPWEVVALRHRRVLPPKEFWSEGWYLALSKGGSAWAMAEMAVGANPREAMRVKLFGFTKHVTGKVDQGNCFSAEEFRRVDAWTALALWRLERYWPGSLAKLDPEVREYALHVFAVATKSTPGRLGRLPCFITNQRLHLGRFEKNRWNPDHYIRLRWEDVVSVTSTTSRGTKAIVVKFRSLSPDASKGSVKISSVTVRLARPEDAEIIVRLAEERIQFASSHEARDIG